MKTWRLGIQGPPSKPLCKEPSKESEFYRHIKPMYARNSIIKTKKTKCKYSQGNIYLVLDHNVYTRALSWKNVKIYLQSIDVTVLRPRLESAATDKQHSKNTCKKG